MSEEKIVYYGEPVKVLGTFTKEDGTEVVKLGGHLVRFSGPKDPDLEGEFFTADTDFGTLSRKGSADLAAYYQHGFDPHFKRAPIGDAQLRFDDFGVWAEYQLELRSDYERHLVEMARNGKMGQSSGAVAHLVDRERVGKTAWIKTWPIGEASLTPTPAEPRTSAVPLKSIFPESTDLGTVNINVNVSQPRETAMSDQKEKAAETQAVEKEKEETKEQSKERSKEESKIVTLEQFQAEMKGLRESMRDDMKAFLEDEKETAPPEVNMPPNYNKETGRGDNYAKGLVHWIRTGDTGGIKHLVGENEQGIQFVTLGANPEDNTWSSKAMLREFEAQKARKASNDTDMNIGTDVDGGHAVPTGHLNQIIERRDEQMITDRLGVRLIPGVGTTVNVPLDNEDDGEFVSTAEAVASDRDAPALGQKAFTLDVYTKFLELSYELLRDETSGVLDYISTHVGRGMAKTHNDLLLTEVAANGTSFKTFAGATAVADGEIEDIEADDDLGAYLDDPSVAWVMRNSTLSAIRKLTASGPRPYAEFSTEDRSVSGGRELIGYPVVRSNKAAAIEASAKSIYFGNWFYVGVRRPDGMQFLRDPFSKAVNRQVRLHYYFSTVYGVLQAEAIGYAEHPSA